MTTKQKKQTTEGWGWGAAKQSRDDIEMNNEKKEYELKIRKEKPSALELFRAWANNGWRGSVAYHKAITGKRHPSMNTQTTTEGYWKDQDIQNQEKEDKKKKKDKKEKTDENQSLTFKQMVKLVQESGGQQQIEPVDEALFTWAQRVAASKFEESTKQEVYAGLVYERMGGIFNMYDVLSESTITENGRAYDIESTLEKYEDSPSATKYLRARIERSSPDSFHSDDVQRARELRAADIEKEDNK